MDNDGMIFDLEEGEKQWWSDTVKEYRAKLVREPEFYIQEVLSAEDVTKETLLKDIDGELLRVREAAWQLYLKDEAEFHREVILHLIQSRDLPKSILEGLVNKELVEPGVEELADDEIVGKVGQIVGEYAGRIMPYIYQLSLSTTQSRRSRAGLNFELIVETFMDRFEIPYETQSAVGSEAFDQIGLGKKVDLIVPSVERYKQRRNHCAVVTMKTTLRERWQEVTEELHRTNALHIFLLTLDTGLSANVLNTIRPYNITLVVPASEKSKFPDENHVQSFESFFTKEMPHIQGYWA